MITEIKDSDLLWIAPETRRIGKNLDIETAYFKQLITLADKSCASALIRISANSRYCLYVNGTPISDGPCKGTEWYHFCDTIDIAPYLHAGVNVIAVKVVAFHTRLNTADDSHNLGPGSVMSASIGPMLMLKGGICEANGGVIDISTGSAEWFCQTDEAVTWRYEPSIVMHGNLEDADGGKLPHGWIEKAEIGTGFTKAVTRLNSEVSYGEFTRLMLFERPIPFLTRDKLPALTEMEGTGNLHFDTDGKAVCAPNQTYSIVLEAPVLTTSYVSVTCEGGAGSTVTLSYSEGFVKRDVDGRIYKQHRKDATGEFDGVSDIYRPGGQTEVYAPFWFRTFLIMRVEVTTGAEGLVLYAPELTETRYPLESKAEAVSNAQDWVAPVWDISLRTLQMCMHETYEDCPFYEQLQYIMDTRLHMLFTYAVSNDTRMAKRTIHDFHTSLLPEGICQSRYPSNKRQVIPAFSLHWVLMVHDYVQETSDIEFVKPYRYTIERIFNWFDRHKNEQGLVTQLGYWDFADWADKWASGIPNAVAHGPGTINNLSYAYTMKTIAPLFAKLGLPELGEFYANEAQTVMGAVMKHCWSNERQLLREGPDFEEYSQHAQVWAVLCGLFTGKEAALIMDKTLQDKSLVPCSFVMQFYMFRALEEAGLYAKTEGLWEMWRSLLDDGLTTVPEIPGPYTRSDCHAWGALMLYEFPRKALGVSPLMPGYNMVEIRPRAMYLGHAAGVVPTPHGLVMVDWTVDGCKFDLRAETPVPARIVLPDGTVMLVEAGKHSYSVRLH